MSRSTKILVLQLARLGDIFQTWPTLRGLKRHDPDCEIHLVTREKFAAAAPNPSLDGIVDKVWALDTRSVLTPLVDEIPDIGTSLERLGNFARSLKEEKYDRILNLSFSPFSSYLTREIAASGADVRGYTRFNDGYLSIPDDGSAYFYSQVGPDRFNRVHLTDLFAHVSGVELQEVDWAEPAVDRSAVCSPIVQEAAFGSIVVHVGASDPGKTFEWTRWTRVVRGLLERTELRVVLVGSGGEAEIADRICQFADSTRVVNAVGRTDLRQLIEIVRRARLLIGGDSAPVQIASLTNTPVLNLSFPMVSFWETGPRSVGSRILPVDASTDTSSDLVVDEAVSMLSFSSAIHSSVVRVPGPVMPYFAERKTKGDFEWQLLKAVYMGEAFPPPPDDLFLMGAARLDEVNRLAREQIATLVTNASNQAAAQILDRVDEIIEQIQGFVPRLAPLVRWFQTERLRLGPMPMNELIGATDRLHVRLGEVLSLYVDSSGDLTEGGESDGIFVG